MSRVAFIILSLLFFGSLRVNADSIMPLDTTKWYNKTYEIKGVTIKAKRSRYNRKDNPSVDLMRRVIAEKKRTRLSERDYYRYDRYQKLTFAANGITIDDLQEGVVRNIPDVINQVEACPYNNKLILPLSVSETVSEKIYSKKPKREREIIRGERASGVDQLFRSSETFSIAMRDYFTDVDIYDDDIRLFQNRLTSPIADAAIAFYRFYITDTIAVAGDSCIHLRFMPNNQRDFGFSGDIYIVKDSSYQVKRCQLVLPRNSTINFVEGLVVNQEFTKASDGEWLLTTDDMLVELSLFDFMNKAVVIRNTRLSGHDFSPIDDKEFDVDSEYDMRRKAKQQDEDFWRANRQMDLTRSEERMDEFVGNIEKGERFKYIKLIVRTFIENHIETSTKKNGSKFDIGPVNTFVTHNSIDGLRLRMGGQTTANLNPHLFVNGYYAHGFNSHNDYYKAEVTYSFNKKDYLPKEFPMRNITFTSTNDIGTPMDKFMTSDKDNIFTSFKWASTDKMLHYNRQQLRFDREEKSNWRTSLVLTAEKNTACGDMVFANDAPIRTTEARVELRFAPGEKFVDRRNKRLSVNKEAPIFTLSHAVGFDGVLGGEYNYHHTEFTVFKRVWIVRWGHLDLNLAAGAQWEQVPFPLLCLPKANLSYILQPATFNLINNMEFLNDRYVSFSAEWDLNGKVFNRIPLLNKLNWREYIGVKTLWGTLTDKNNPSLPANSGSDILMPFPSGSFIMDKDTPYVELLFGVHNVFRFFHIEYVRRLNYLDLPTANKHGVRMKFSVQF